MSITTLAPKFGSTQSTVYGGVPPVKDKEITPEFVF
jgi:hypothetical protein